MSLRSQQIAILRWIAVSSVAVALLATIGAFRFYRSAAPRIQQLYGQLAELEKIRVSIRDAEKAMDALQSINRRIPLNLNSLVQRAECRVWCRVSDTRIRRLLPGWLLYEAEISLQGIPADKLSQLVMTLENSRPPWRIREYQLRGADEGGGENPINGKLCLQAVGMEPPGGKDE
ncbi:MAG: hypothetical protein DRP22_04735 [Verrucomicrobia bacterium]|nr:MAG: hypothetical protein DRP22_04735 [Verrucomicrobiota bacterium]